MNPTEESREDDVENVFERTYNQEVRNTTRHEPVDLNDIQM